MTAQNPMVCFIDGIVIYRNFFSPVAPSKSAASYKEYGISRVAAVMIVKVYPKFLQTVTIMTVSYTHLSEDILDPNNWKKSRNPVLCTDEEKGVFGPGHNSFVKSEDGTKDIKVFYETEIGRAVHIMQRKSCYQCRFNGNGHYADVTIGDYHGADPEKEYYNPYGTSILVVNTLKGKRLFESISKDENNIFPADYDRIAKTNPRLKESWPPHLIRGQFSEWMQQKGLFIAARNSWSLRQRIRKEIPYGLRMVVRNLKSKINGGGIVHENSLIWRQRNYKFRNLQACY